MSRADRTTTQQLSDGTVIERFLVPPRSGRDTVPNTYRPYTVAVVDERGRVVSWFRDEGSASAYIEGRMREWDEGHKRQLDDWGRPCLSLIGEVPIGGLPIVRVSPRSRYWRPAY